MPNNHEPLTGHDNYWLTIDEAAAALDVTKWRAYQMARRDEWRHTPTKPRGYLMADIKTTARQRKAKTMTDVENTTDRDPIEHLAGMTRADSSTYIESMEHEGQQQLVASTLMPTDAPWDELTALGFTRSPQLPGDGLFVDAHLPTGWRREFTDHDMWSHIVDEDGVTRVEVFYKAAFYDRRAFARLTRTR